jgi:MFS family permease
MSPVGLVFALLAISASPTAIGTVLAASMGTRVVMTLAGGVWGDRLPKHLVMVVANIVHGVAQGWTAVLLFTDTATVWNIAALAVVNGIASSFMFPASQGILPQVVTTEQLHEANALLRLGVSSTAIGGAAIGGVLVSLVGPATAIAVDALSFFAAAALVAAMPLPRDARMRGRNFVGDLIDGWRAFVAQTWVWVMVVTFAFINAISSASFLVLGPVIAKQDLGGPRAWGLILAAYSAGLVLGGLTALRWKPSRPQRTAMLVVMLVALPLVFLAWPAPAAVVALGACASGASIEFSNILWTTALQRTIPTDRLARVNSYDSVGSLVLMPIGYAVVGPIAVAVGTSTTLVACAVAIVAIIAAAMTSSEVRMAKPSATTTAPATLR